MKILFAGGGTLGSVTPLLAVWDECKKKGDTALWIGTYAGVERAFVERVGIPFAPVHGGKLRRYFHVKNFLDPFLLLAGMAQSLVLIFRFRPDVIMSAGSYIAVPVIFAGWLLGKKSILLQLDIVPTLSNILTEHFAETICASCEESAKSFNPAKTVVTGVPVRESIRKKAQLTTSEQRRLRSALGIADSDPIILVLGGGTGAKAVNEILWKTLDALTSFAHVFHLTGYGKEGAEKIINERYHSRVNAFEDFPDLLAASDVVVARCGIGTLSELSCLGKAALIIPLPNSHQVRNAIFAEKHGAARYCDQEDLCKNPGKLVSEIQAILQRDHENFSSNMRTLFPSDAAKGICERIHFV